MWLRGLRAPSGASLAWLSWFLGLRRPAGASCGAYGGRRQSMPIFFWWRLLVGDRTGRRLRYAGMYPGRLWSLLWDVVIAEERGVVSLEALGDFNFCYSFNLSVDFFLQGFTLAKESGVAGGKIGLLGFAHLGDFVKKLLWVHRWYSFRRSATARAAFLNSRLNSNSGSYCRR